MRKKNVFSNNFHTRRLAVLADFFQFRLYGTKNINRRNKLESAKKSSLYINRFISELLERRTDFFRISFWKEKATETAVKFASEPQNLLFWALPLVWLFHFLFNFELWAASSKRSFPLTNFFLTELDFGLFVRLSMMSLVIISLFLPVFIRKTRVISFFVFIALLILFVLEDIARIQPYYFFYTLVFAALVFGKNEAVLTASLRLITGGCYLWGGIFKLNEFFPESIRHVFLKTGMKFFQDVPSGFFWSIPVWEVMLGLFILDFTARKIPRFAFAAALLLHSCIIFVLLSAQWNRVVVPWNVFMSATVLVIYFLEQKKKAPSGGVKINFTIFSLAFLAVFAPAANLFGYGNAYLSWRVYTGNAEVFLITEADYPNVKTLPCAIFSKETGKHFVYVNHWLADETRTLFPPDRSSFKKLLLTLRSKKNAENTEP